MVKRILNVLSSRFFLAALCIVLEFAQLLAVFVLLYKYFLPITILGWIFHIGVLLYLINRDEIPEVKLPWLIILCVFPVVGAFIFMLVASNSTSKKDYERAEKAHKELLPYLRQTKTIKALKSENAEAYAQANYLYSEAEMPCYANSKVTYYKIGEDFHAALLEELSKAKEYIIMEYFIIEEGAMWNPIHELLKEKAKEGVAVYLMYDDFGCMMTLPENYEKQLCEEGINCLTANRFKPILSHIHNNRDHRKITVIDGKVGFTGGINIADEYINAIDKLGHWKDTAVRIEGGAVRNLIALFINSWNTQSKELLNPADFMKSAESEFCANGVIIPFGDGPKPIYKEEIGKNVYLNMIYAAKKTLYITTPYLICDRELLGALKIAAKRGVDVRIITPHIPDKKIILMMTRSNYQALVQSGVKIYEYTPGFIHAKNVICDDNFAVCGTINFDYRSLVHHFECAAWLYGTDCIADMKEDFLQTAAVSERITHENARLKLFPRVLANVLKVFAYLL